MNKDIYVIQKQWCGKDGWSEWADAFTFGIDYSATNDLFDVLQSYYLVSRDPQGLDVVPHRWRVWNDTEQEVVEMSGQVNIIQLCEYGSYDVAGCSFPDWALDEGPSRNMKDNKVIRPILDEMRNNGERNND